jgi:hypothetical protein
LAYSEKCRQALNPSIFLEGGGALVVEEASPDDVVKPVIRVIGFVELAENGWKMEVQARACFEPLVGACEQQQGH